jgi:hypothetical protein
MTAIVVYKKKLKLNNQEKKLVNGALHKLEPWIY